jgi:hypothetical protein
MRHIGAIIVTVILLGVLPVWAEVVELKTGQRVEGNFKEATARGVVIEVGGQAIAFPREKVRAIYFGPVPAPTQPSGIQEALRALKALQSVTSAGVNYRDYAPRVGDAKIQVDRYVSEPKGTIAETRSAIAAAMGFYILASSAWSASMTND